MIRMFDPLILILVSLISLGFMGCATPIHSAFSKLEIGDDKSVVIERLGSPKHSIRRDGKDYWVYRYYRGDSEFKRTLSFEKSKLASIENEEQVVDPKELLIEKDLENMTPESFKNEP